MASRLNIKMLNQVFYNPCVSHRMKSSCLLTNRASLPLFLQSVKVQRWSDLPKAEKGRKSEKQILKESTSLQVYYQTKKVILMHWKQGSAQNTKWEVQHPSLGVRGAAWWRHSEHPLWSLTWVLHSALPLSSLLPSFLLCKAGKAKALAHQVVVTIKRDRICKAFPKVLAIITSQ